MWIKRKRFAKLFLLLLIVNVCWLISFSKADATSYDEIPPRVGCVRILQDEIYAPDVLKIELSDIVEDGAGITSVKFRLNGDLTFERTLNKALFTNDKYIFECNIPAKVESTEYRISFMSIQDAEENTAKYILEDVNPGSKYELLSDNGKCTVQGLVKIHGENFVFSTANTNPNLPKMLSDMKAGETANIFMLTDNTTVPKAAFDAIKGTNKKINVSVSDGVKWLFNGKDITGTTKAVNCGANISTAQKIAYGTTDRLMKINFASNGILPGKATIKLKSDYLSKLYNLDQKLYLYYLNGKKLTLESSDVEVKKIGSNSWCEFEIDHSSTFLLSQKKLTYKKPYVKLNVSMLTMQVKQSSTALKVSSKLGYDEVKKWASSKSRVVSVDRKTGKLKAKKPGTAYITVLLNSGAKTRCKVGVQKAPVKTRSIAVGKTRITLKRGETYKIPVIRKPITASDGKITYKSSKSKIARVSRKGTVKALKKGKAAIVVKAGKKSKKISIIVK